MENFQNLIDKRKFSLFASEILKFIINKRDLKYILTSSIESKINPGFISNLFEKRLNTEPISFLHILEEFEKIIYPYLSKTYHPNNLGMRSSDESYASIVGSILSLAFGGNGFAWRWSPIMTELEDLMVNWYGHLMGIPGKFLSNESNKKGCGFLCTGPEEGLYNIFLAARKRFFNNRVLGLDKSNLSMYLGKLVIYASTECSLAIYKICQMEHIRLHLIDTEEGAMPPNILKNEIEKDVAKGYFPLMIICTLGTFTTFGIDNIRRVYNQAKIKNYTWIHIDASYGGSALILNQYNHIICGLDMADSMLICPDQFMQLSFDCTILYVDNIEQYSQAFQLNGDEDTIELSDNYKFNPIKYQNFGITLTRRFRALKMFIIFRLTGSTGLIQSVRKLTDLRKILTFLLKKSFDIEIIFENFTFFYFKLKHSNEQRNKEFYEFLYRICPNIAFMPFSYFGQYCIRACLNNSKLEPINIYMIADEIQNCAAQLKVTRSVAVKMKAKRTTNSSFDDKFL